MADTAAATVTAGVEKEKMLTLRSSDGEEFQVEQSVATESQTIKHMIEEGCVNTGIPLPNVTARILSKVIVLFCRKHAQARVPDTEDGEASSKPERTSTEDLKAFDKDFVEVDQATLFELILAANYLDIKRLLDLTAQAIADIIKEKTPEEIRTTFNIKNDFTPDEEAEVRREAQWAFE